MVETSGSSYKDRYLKALDDIERIEKQHGYQLDVLRKTLINVSAAAQGLDKSLDVSLRQLKESMRGASGSQVLQNMEKVQQAVEVFERNREREHLAVAEKMRQSLKPFFELKLPGELHDKLRKFSQSLNTALSHYRTYPRVLADLTLLQESAIHAATNPPTSFFQRLRGGKTLQSITDMSGKAGSTERPLKPESLQLAPESSAKAEHNVAPSLAGYGVDPIKRVANHLLDEDSYEKVAGRIALTLRELMENIEPNDVIRHRVDLVRSRIERGLDWYALSVTLEDIRDILMQRYLDVDREFSQYLQDVNKELAVISGVLGVALKREAEVNLAASTLSEAVTDEVTKIQKSVDNSTSLDSLKQAVSSHLDIIADALCDYRKVHQQEGGASLSDELKQLLEKVEAIEHESSKTKEMLEAERHRATHDALTGLPNREAYNERAFHEQQRFLRYSHNLSLSVCDIDFFKKVNDTYGHQAGDKVLKLIAKVISTRLRKVDFVARYGGEEFVILLPETLPSQAKLVLDKIRRAVSEAAFRFKDTPVKISISFGITGFVSEDTVESAFARADKALYEAKSAGRDCCVIGEPEQNKA